MKRSVKIFITVLLAAALLFSVPVCAFASTSDTAATINVQLNGQMLDLGSNTPVSKENRTFIPFRSVLSALGATVDYDQQTGMITAQKGDKTICFEIGKADITITEDGTTQILTTDAPSFASHERTLVPIRFVAQALDYKVGWDPDNKTVIIMDTASLLAPYEGKFTILDKFLTYNAKYSSGNYAFNGDIDLNMDITVEEQTYPVSAEGAFSGLVNEDSEEMNFNLAFDTTELLAIIPEEDLLDPATQDMLSVLKNIEIDYIFNLKDGIFYMSSPVFSSLLGLPEDAWLSMNYNTILNQSGMDSYQNLMSLAKTTTTCDLMQQILDMVPINSVTGYEEIATLLQMIENTVGDRAFTQNGNVYTAKANMTLEGVTIIYQFDITMKNDAVSAYTLAFDLSDDTTTLTLDMSQNTSDEVDLSMTMDMEDLFTLELSMDMNYKETTKVPAIAPPADATVMPLDGLLNY